MLAETICSAASAAGLGIAAITAYRKRFLAATRIAAYSLVPLALVLTGVVEWVSGIAFNPEVWVGFGLLGLSWLLFTTTRAVERRRRVAVAPQASAPSLGAGPPAAARSKQPKRQPQAKAAKPQGEDFSDIEEILKKHGI